MHGKYHVLNILQKCLKHVKPKSTETDLKKSQICPIWGQSDPIWNQPWHPLCVFRSRACVAGCLEMTSLASTRPVLVSSTKNSATMRWASWPSIASASPWPCSSCSSVSSWLVSAPLRTRGQRYRMGEFVEKENLCQAEFNVLLIKEYLNKKLYNRCV